MSEPVHITHYRCRTCRHVFTSQSSADACEGKPVTYDRGVKVGDKVRITDGDGKGSTATVECIHIIDREWGHYAWERYWHTVALTAKVDNSYGHRMLTFDNYVVMPLAELGGKA